MILPIAIAFFLVAMFVWIAALLKTAKGAHDNRMSQAWLEEQRRKESQ